MANARVGPFSVNLLKRAQGASVSSLLPAASRNNKDDNIEIPSVENGALFFLSRDLLVTRLNDVHESLWMAGRPMPPRHLGYQILLSREVVVTEDISLHLVWQGKRIFIKPLPTYLLDERLWKQCLGQIVGDNAEVAKNRESIAQCAKGLLLSYCALICYESDFRSAQTLGLLPNEIKWKQWRLWVAEIITNCPYDQVNRRFWYGELRLGRLNKIYRLRRIDVLRGYSRVGTPSNYGELLSENFGALAVALGYVVIVLTAMQVGLATNHLEQNTAFQGASWVFTVISIIAPLATVAGIFIYFLAIFIANWKATKRYESKRSGIMGVQIRKGEVASPNKHVASV